MKKRLGLVLFEKIENDTRVFSTFAKPAAVSSKYHIVDFTESYRHAEGRHTFLLPAAMVIVVVISFWLVARSRPAASPAPQEPVSATDRFENGQVEGISIAAPPKIELDFDFEDAPGAGPVSPPKVDPATPVPSKATVIPKAKVISAPSSSRTSTADGAGTKAGQFTPWMTPGSLNAHILKLNSGHELSFWDRGHWIIAVEGRQNGSTQEFRIIYEETPQDRDFQWRYRIDQTQPAFLKNLKEMKNAGYTLVQSQAFQTSDRSLRYQAVWQRLD